ncbi:MAG TPA: hypothetical protein VMY34_10220, partial [Acidimicrobiales bacterium]|nr:hypothetical protein [Acidimicrobiales bacterium]
VEWCVMKKTLGTLCLALAVGMLAPPPSEAASGSNERILFERSFNSSGGYAPAIYLMNTDGSNMTVVKSDAIDPSWSKDGKRVVFTGLFSQQIFTMKIDGSDLRQLTSTTGYNRWAQWSPDGSRIAFTSTRDGGDNEIYVMNADGSGQTRLTAIPGVDYFPTWSPDGAKIAFTSGRAGLTHIFVMNADGSAVTRLTTSGAGNIDPAYSPDGTKIAFASFRFGSTNAYELMVMNADGTNQVRLSTNPGNDDSPTWSPDGTRILYSARRNPETVSNKTSLVVINADGTNLTQLTSGSSDTSSSWATLPTCSDTGSSDNERGPVSSLVHDAEPLLPIVGPIVHEQNCDTLAPSGL